MSVNEFNADRIAIVAADFDDAQIALNHLKKIYKTTQ